MGAEVMVFTISPLKVADTGRLGATHAVLSSDEQAMKGLRDKLDFILNTISTGHDVNLYLCLLRHDGSLVIVGLPNELLAVAAYTVVCSHRSLAGSNIGGIAERQEMLDFCFKHGITAEGEAHPISLINEAPDRWDRGGIHYHFVLNVLGL